MCGAAQVPEYVGDDGMLPTVLQVGHQVLPQLGEKRNCNFLILLKYSVTTSVKWYTLTIATRFIKLVSIVAENKLVYINLT